MATEAHPPEPVTTLAAAVATEAPPPQVKAQAPAGLVPPASVARPPAGVPSPSQPPVAAAAKAKAKDAPKKRKSSSLGKDLKRKWDKKVDDCTTSRYRGVTKHRRSGRWESHIWVAAKGKQIYLGGYELEEHAASAYDVARLKIKGRAARTNFDMSKYEEILPYLEVVTFDDLVTAVRRQSQGFAKCPSGVKWVTRHASGKWEAKALVGSCSKFINLGLFDTENGALAAYHKAMTKMSGVNNNTMSSALPLADVSDRAPTINLSAAAMPPQPQSQPQSVFGGYRNWQQPSSQTLSNVLASLQQHQNPNFFHY